MKGQVLISLESPIPISEGKNSMIVNEKVLRSLKFHIPLPESKNSVIVNCGVILVTSFDYM